MMYTYGQAGAGNEQWTLLGRYIDDDYGPYEKAPRLFGTLSLGNILVPSHPVMQGITDLGTGDRHDGMLTLTPGGVKLAEWQGGYPAIGVKELANGARSVHLSGGGYTPIQGDFDIYLRNALLWAGENIMGEPIGYVEHAYGDNGVYYVDLMTIDDDMDWTWNWKELGGPAPGDQPIPGPTADIKHNIIPITIDNCDPTSSNILARAELDLVIRTTGEPNNDCTMTLWDGGTALGSVTVYHEGNYKMETLPAVLDVGRINDYSVTVEYDNGDAGGANPTWVFEGRFPSGHTKELKKVFKDDGTIWTIGADLLRTMLLGEDIIFMAMGYDPGSDDLAFVWNFGDGEYGINVYANQAPGVAVEGVNAPAPELFDVLANREPWFDKPLNDIRSPRVNPIWVFESETHAFDEPFYYYVSLLLCDDDVCDGYPSYQTFMNGGGYDMEFIEIDLR
jgi:hypothetical protein